MARSKDDHKSLCTLNISGHNAAARLAHRETFAGGGQTTVVLSPKSEFFKYFGEGPGEVGKRK